MRINSVNPVNSNHQRSQNFGMAVRLGHPELPYRIAEGLDAQGISRFNEALAKLKQGQESNKLTDILIIESPQDGSFYIDLVRQPDYKVLRTLSPNHTEYQAMAEPDNIIRRMVDANQLADSYSGLTETVREITTV